MKIRILLSLPLLALSIVVLVSACSKQDEPQSPPVETQIADKKLAAGGSGSPSAEIINSQSGTTDTDTKVVEENKPDAQATDTPAESPTLQAATSQQTTASTNTDDHKEQLSLARKSGCLACHAIDKKVVGPAWRDVSKRYMNDPDAKSRLITKVSKGGRGNWVDVVGAAAMPPYSPRVSDQNIALLVEFILSLEQ